MKEDILEIYMNYLYAKRMHEEYGNLFGDTDDIIEYFEKKINDELNHINNDKVYKKYLKD